MSEIKRQGQLGLTEKRIIAILQQAKSLYGSKEEIKRVARK